MRRKSFWVTVLASFASLFLGAAPALAQTQATTGVIEGTVTDPSGGVVSGATVTMTNTGTGYERQVTTNESGFYRGVLLPLGAYKVTVEKSGFATMMIKDVELTLGASNTINAALKLQSGAEQITVTSEEPLVHASQTETSAGLDAQQLHSVPVSNRNYLDLLTLTPNVSISNGTDGPEINVNGQKGTQTSFNVDGANANNVFFGEQRGGQRPVANVGLEAVREFQVVAEGAPAEFGGYSGAFINVVTKSGTNDFHGSLFHLQDLEALTAALADGSSLNGYHREQYGASLGGPIKKDKLFFFGTYEGANTRFNTNNSLVHCCTVTAANGIATFASPANGGVPADLNQIFTTRFGSPEAGPIKRTNDLQSFLVKGDWIPNARHNVTLRHYFARSIQDNGTFDIPTFGRTANGQERSKSNTFVGSWTWAISSKYLNEFRFEYGRENRPRTQVLPPDLPDTSIGACTQPDDFSSPVAGCFAGGSAIGNGRNYRFGRPFFHPSFVVDEQFQESDNFSIITGNHAVKFGFMVDNIRVQNFFAGFARGRYTFDTVEGFLNYINLGPTFVECADGTSGTSGNFGSTLAGNATCLNNSANIVGPLLLYLQFAPVGSATLAQASNNNFHQFESGLFLQDKWQARPGLTISYGLRWDNYNQRDPILPPAQTRIGQFLGNPAFRSNGTVPSYHKAFQPRLGIAWDPWHNGKTVIRANGGMFFSRLPALIVANGTANNGALGATIFEASFLNGPANAFNLGFLVPPVYPDCATGTFAPPICPTPANFSPFDPGVVLFAKDFVYPRSLQASLWVERQIAKDWAISAGFNYALGTHQNRVEGFNVPPANGTGPDGRTLYTGNGGSGPFSGPGGNGSGIATFSSLLTSNATSVYRSFAVKVDKKYSRNILLSAQYTYAHDDDQDSNERDQFTAKFSDPKNFGPEHGPSDRDRRHRFSAFALWNLPWGFSWSNTFSAFSATPRSLLCNFDANGDSFSDNDRVFTDGHGNYSCGAGGVGNIIDLGSGKTATLVGALTGGHDSGRNTFRKGDQYFDWSMRIQKDFRIHDRLKLSPSAEIFNIIGGDNLRFPVCGELRGCFDGTFLQIPGDPRRARLGLRLEW
ncbi:MAG: TonB-dependent receptor [Acidipila sp.]|nr:TonB-dependent receptor [Acidipila sp.]